MGSCGNDLQIISTRPKVLENGSVTFSQTGGVQVMGHNVLENLFQNFNKITENTTYYRLVVETTKNVPF